MTTPTDAELDALETFLEKAYDGHTDICPKGLEDEGDENCRCAEGCHRAKDAITALREQVAAQDALLQYRGFAHLGVGAYLINHSRAGVPAELVISLATEKEKEGRVVGDERDNEPDAELQPEAMTVRLRFSNVAGLDALEQQLRYLRDVHFTDHTDDRYFGFPPQEKNWTANYQFDKTDDATRLFCAASDWMDRALAAEADNAALLTKVRQCLTMTRSEAQLLAGEMTAGEWRTVSAILVNRIKVIDAMREGKG